jgi:DNA-binding transcriptional MerR regulator
MKAATKLPTRPVRMAALARLSGVPAATIKHYLREGLLPQPALRTARNTAFYDASLAERIKQIKTLQREHFLPLRVIKSVLEGRVSDVEDAETRAAIQRALTSMESKDVRTRDQLLASGAPADDLALLERLGIITAKDVGGEDTFSGDDLTLLRLLGTSRRAGITREMLPPDIVASYVQAIQELVRMELELFRVGVAPRAGENLAAITDAATRLSEQLVVLIRRKLLLPTLEALVNPKEKAS